MQTMKRMYGQTRQREQTGFKLSCLRRHRLPEYWPINTMLILYLAHRYPA
ncbi:hypothetical protein FOPG_19253 [Fusarium oxysporum f. sp. conglutinans race 2 54008]|uniref:Uncharacterized protein n=1 Tax=Fusarium oxysporum f. sp. conglutinans race 2 54008 TaxID=1089457 RepID=X0GMG5_FUSOX|nr:hypothetical protein FOPG_19253 [Fusarium oxysporum f. sp. conglutinans race 2 54008]